MANFAIVGATGVVGTKMIESLGRKLTKGRQYIFNGISQVSRKGLTVQKPGM